MILAGRRPLRHQDRSGPPWWGGRCRSAARPAHTAELLSVAPAKSRPQFTVSVAVFVTVPAVAVIVTVCVDATLDVVIVKVAVVLPWSTVTVNGTEATRTVLDFRTTTCPPANAGPDSVTVPVALAPPLTCVGDTVTLCNCPTVCGFTVNVAFCEPTASYVAVMVTVRAAVTAEVVMVNVAVVWPEGTLTEPCACAMELALDVTVMVAPEVGAALPSVTVAVTLVPPITELSASVSCSGGTTVTCRVCELPSVAVRLTVWTAVTAPVGIVKFAVLLLA